MFETRSFLRNLALLNVLLFLLISSSQYLSHQNALLKKVDISEEKSKRAMHDPHAPALRVLGTNNYLMGGVISQTVTSEPSVRIEGRNIAGEVTIDIYEATKEDIISYLIYDDDQKQKYPETDLSNRRRVGTTRTRLSGSYWDQTPIALPIEGKGIWALHIFNNETETNAFVIRSSIGSIFKEGTNEFVVWTQDFTTGRSVDGGIVQMLNLRETHTVVHERGIDGQGLATAPIADNVDIAFVERGEDIALVPVNLKYLNSEYASWYNQRFGPTNKRAEFFLFTDRPLYKPGDTVYFKTIIRQDDDARYFIPLGTAKVTISYGYPEEKIFDRTYTITADGTVYGEFTLPDTVRADQYRITVDLDPSAPEYDYTLETSNYFRVEHYRKPEYFIDLSASKREHVEGDTATVTVHGEYFFGQPLSGKTVSYKVLLSNFYEYSYYSQSQASLSDDYRYGYYYGDTIHTGSVTLNENGEADIVLATDLPDERTGAQVFTVEAEYIDESGNPSFARKNLLIYDGEYSIYKKDHWYSMQAGEPATIAVEAIARDGTSWVGEKITAEIQRNTWIRYQGYTYREEKEILPSISAVTDETGTAQFSFTPPTHGRYTLTLSGVDKRDNSIKREFTYWAQKQGEPLYRYQRYQDSGITITSDKESYEHSEHPYLTIHSDLPDRDVFLSFDRARVNRYQIVHLNGTSDTIETSLTETDMPNIYVKVATFTDSGIATDRVNLVVSTDSKRLTTRITPDRTTYGPGDTVHLDISTTDNAGNPIAADTAVWAVDKALYELVSENPLEIHNAFWFERWDDTQEAHSLQGIRVQPAAEMGGCFAGDTPIRMADGTTKRIEDVQTGDMVLTRTGQHNATGVPARVNNTFRHEVVGYFIINKHLKVTPTHRLWVNNDWKQAMDVKIGDTLLSEENVPIVIDSIEWQHGVFIVYNLEIDTYQTYFAGGVWVHNQKGGGGESRTTFKDTAYWNPSIHTNTNGHATVTFTLPDNVTTWVISAVGSTTDTKLGKDRQEIVVTKDIIVRPILPNIFRTGDTIDVSAIVNNFTTESRTFTVSLESDNEVLDTQTRTVTLAPDGYEQVTWTISPRSEQEKAHLTFTAVDINNSAVKDMIVQEIPILDYGFRETSVHVATGPTDYAIQLQEDSDVNKSIVSLSLSPALLGTLPAAMNYLVQYPYGCVEQTTSRFVPAVIAKAHPDIFATILENRDVDAMIEKGLTRLKNLQLKNGGWGWWTGGNANSYITAYVIEYIDEAERLGFAIDPGMKQGYMQYLQTDSQNQTYEDTVLKQYTLSLLGNEKGSMHLNNFDIDPDILALAVMHNVRIGYTGTVESGLQALLDKRTVQGSSQTYWEQGPSRRFGSQDASTALAMRALIAAGADEKIIAQTARYLLATRKGPYWSNTFGTAQVARAVTDQITIYDDTDSSYTYSVFLDGTRLKTGSVSDFKTVLEDIVIPGVDIQPSGSTLTIEQSDGPGTLHSTLLVDEFKTATDATAQTNGLSISRDYSGKDGGKSFNIGDVVTVNLTVSGLNNNTNYAVIEDQLPAGMIPINTNFANEQFNTNTSSPYWGDSREVTLNGMILGLHNIYSGTRTYSYTARVVSRGTFHVPPATAELMYTPEVHGHSDAQTVVIAGDNSSISPLPATPPTYELRIDPPQEHPGIGPLTPKFLVASILAELKNRFAVIGILSILLGTAALIIFFRRKRKKPPTT